MSDLDAILPPIRARAGEYDRTGNWPAADLAELARIGAMRWALPADTGGEDLDPLELHIRYEAIASASLATALILSQRDSAVGLIDGADNAALRSELLHLLNENRSFSTVGIAQLTTSRQGGAPALLAIPDDGGYRLDGLVPWATGADRSDFIVTAAAIAGGGQLLFALFADQPGVTIAPPMPLVALAASRTTSIRCQGVHIPATRVLRGPCDRVLAGRRKGLSIGQAFLATGLCRGAIELIRSHDSTRGVQLADDFEAQLRAIRHRVRTHSTEATPDPAQTPILRGECNELAVRVTHAAIALFKGTALTMGHPAQRLAREAMFLLVWSCPDPVIDCTVELLARRL